MDPFWSINGWKGLSSSVTQRQDIGGEAVKTKKGRELVNCCFLPQNELKKGGSGCGCGCVGV